MDRYRLKNVIIIILLLVNGFLLASLALRSSASRSARERADSQLIALFAEDNMTLYPEAISRKTPPSALTLTRNTAREREAAAFLLGNTLSLDGASDGIYTTYSSSTGTAQFRSNGTFDITGSLSEDNAEELCRSFCRTFSFDDPVFTLDENGSGFAVATGRHSSLPVYNGTVTFTIDRGTVLSASGTLLPDSSIAVTSEEELLPAIAALTAFQQFRRESGTSASSVTDMYLCYELQTSTAVPMSLSPSWCVVTNISKYYVNAVSGKVSTG